MREDLDAMLNALSPIAEKMLSKRGEFYPIGGQMSSQGEITMCGAHPGSERPSSREVMDMLAELFRVRYAAGEIRACGTCYMGSVANAVGRPQDAIICDIETPTESGRVAILYKKRLLGGYRYSEITRLAYEPTVFLPAK